MGENTALGLEEEKSTHRLKYYLLKPQEWMPARRVLYFLSFSGFLVSFMMRTDINIAMVAMVKARGDGDNTTTAAQVHCQNPDANDHAGDIPATEEGEFDWDSDTQSIILGSFYWSYIMSQVAGGALSHKFGTKVVFGGAQLLTAFCALLIPGAASLHYGALVAIRSIQGVASGLTWPAMFAIVGHWIPPSERSRFMSSFQGMSIGIGLTYPLCGFLIAHFGWRVVFYVTGTVGGLWCVVWWFLAYDTPAQHPRITREERVYIESCVMDTVVSDKGMPVPWKQLTTSVPVWAITITTFGRIWANYTFIIPGPMYMKTVLGFSIQANGLLSGLPFLCSYLSSVVFCYVADQLAITGRLSLTNVRKLFSAISQIGPGILVLVIGYVGCDITSAVIMWFLAVTFLTASYAGAMANIVDLAPNLGGPILSFAQTFHMTASFLSPLVAGFLTKGDQSVEQWRKVFGVTAGIAISTYVFYHIFGTAEVQSWNFPAKVDPEEDGATSPVNSDDAELETEKDI